MNTNDTVIEIVEHESSIHLLSICVIGKEANKSKNNNVNCIVIDDSDDSCDEKQSSTESNNVINIVESPDDEEFIKRLLLCSICNSSPNENDAVELPTCHRFCKKCLSKYVKDIGLNQNDYKCPNSECKEKFEIERWLVSNGVLNEEDFNQYDMFKLKQLISEETLYYCINPACKCCFILEDGEVHDEITGETDSGGNVMNLRAIQHRDKYRVRCIKFETNWCIKCKVSPYHLGKTCEEYETYLKLRKCRYCKNVLEDQNSKFDICISNKECKEKSKLCCTKKLKCGHPCYGIKKCRCLPCLVAGCNYNKEKEKEIEIEKGDEKVKEEKEINIGKEKENKQFY